MSVTIPTEVRRKAQAEATATGRKLYACQFEGYWVTCTNPDGLALSFWTFYPAITERKERR